MRLDPADFNIISGTLQSIAAEMGDVLIRSAYSSIVREAADCSACIADAAGRLVAQPEMNAIHLNSMAAVFEYAREKIDFQSLLPEEAIITNNPYNLGQHLNDIFLLLPVFHEGKLVAFSGTICHHLEVGGMIAGSASNATELYHEGLILPTMRINLAKDLYGGPIEQILAANVRLPGIVLGDFYAQLAATIRGRKLLEEAIARYSEPLITAVMMETQSYSERVMRAMIASIPDGEYYGKDVCDGFKLNDPPVTVRVKITIAGDEAIVDLSETDDQVAWPCNSPVASTRSAAYTIFGGLCGAHAPTNDGTYRPVKVVTRAGSFVDPLHPAPVRGRMTAAYRVVSAIKRALISVLPERVPASGNDSGNMISLSRKSVGGYDMFSETLAGGSGAGHAGDGESVVAQTLSNSSNTPIESLEIDHDFLLIVEYSQRVDSGGAGKFRGGLGQRRVYQILADDVLLSTNGDRHGTAPWGSHGGRDGVLSSYTIVRDNQRIRIGGVSTEKLQKGDTLIVELTGGGGFGDPRERSRSLVAADLADGRISANAAKEVYGWVSGHAPA